MPRNLDGRVETLFPVFDKSLIKVVMADLDLILSDNVKAWQMTSDGIYSRISNNAQQINSQSIFLTRSAFKKNT